MKTLIISAITCLLMASCQNEVGRYQIGAKGQILDTKKGIKYYISDNIQVFQRRVNVVTGETARLTKGDNSKYYWKITREGSTEEQLELELD